MLASNANAVEVFRLCKPEYLIGFGVVHYHGNNASEIREIATVLNVELTEDLLNRIKIIEHAFAKVVNRKNK